MLKDLAMQYAIKLLVTPLRMTWLLVTSLLIATTQLCLADSKYATAKGIIRTDPKTNASGRLCNNIL